MKMAVEDTATWASRLNDVDFRAIVDDDTRGRAMQEVSEALRSPALMERWYETLLAMQNSVEGQLGAKEAESKAKRASFRSQGKEDMAQHETSRHEQWRAGALRFKNGLDEKIGESRRILRANGSTLVNDKMAKELANTHRRVRQLEAAIIAHHKASEAAGKRPSDFDIALWTELEVQ